ncbi:asparagine synthase (glutamine-hydrolyzing) [Patescibacteria group bacterium]|nr:asparagine synthase (glutamine-hydrolyzing) [Patescibacteria group bacterium]
MCGINGFNFKDKELIEKMNEKIKHRGPDGSGVYTDDNISLGHRRLSIIDLSENGKQPMFNEDKSLCLIFNGEIYNFKELKEDLKNHTFSSKTDSEVILHLYEEYKEDCLKYLNGIFAFAIYDIKNKELFLARDRIGVKPLYYYHKNDKLIFSSEIKAILEHKIKREIDLEAMNHYFRLMYVPAPLTMFNNIYKLKQGHYLKFKNSNLEIKKYWDVQDFKKIKDKEKIINEIQKLMKKSIKGQLISDKPVGVFLSGGIDSTSVLGIAKEFKKDLKTFSVGFDINDPNRKFNADLDLARKTSKIYNTEHYELLVNSKDVLENLEKVVYHMDEPVAEPTQIATYLLAELAKKHVDVVLGGDGGDELFGGYKRYYYAHLLRFIPFLKSKLHTKFMLQDEKEIKKILLNTKNTTKSFFSKNYLKNGLMFADLKTWLPDESLMRSDKMTMANGLEERVPILDHQLVELGFKTPNRFKMKDTDQGKEIFIEAMKEYLPDHILKSDKKKVWLTPMSEWLRTDLKEFAEKKLFTNLSEEYFNVKEIEKIFNDHIKRKKYNLNLIWALIIFQIWKKKYTEK